MFKDFQQFVPSTFCLKCDGCCRFKQAQSPWRPKITSEEKKPAGEKQVFPETSIDPNDFFSTVPYQDSHICSFFDPGHHACEIYGHRPFECMIYPFVLSKNKKGQGLFVHVNCPYVQETQGSPAFLDYQAYLQDFLRQDPVRSFLKKNPDLFGQYPGFTHELEWLFPLSP